MNSFRSVFLAFCCCVTSAQAQKFATFEVEAQTSGLDAYAHINLDNITFTADSALVLSKVDGNARTPIPFQVSDGAQRELSWMIKGGTSKKIIYELSKGKPAPFSNIEATADNGELTIHTQDKNFLRYVYKTMYPPAGIDTAFKRSAFIHPLWTPHGQVLTRIQAPDHYHHYGLWDPWTHVLFEGDTVDFWNLKSRKGTVRFGNFVSIIEGPVYAEFAALQKHIAFKKDGSEKVALNELQTVRVYAPAATQDYYVVDITIELNCASSSPFKILAYRYAGLGWRATGEWNKTNCAVLTSEGKTRKESDGSTARWCMVSGTLGDDYGGAVMMSYPSNYNHPEPLRVWPENSNNGEMFAMFAPTKNKDWTLYPGKTYTLKYRFLVFNGRFPKENAEAAWRQYSMPPKMTIKTN